MRTSYLALLLFVTPALPAQTQPAILPLDQIHTQLELEQTIRALDTQLFNAYNHCAEPGVLDQFAALFTPDVEFYHDQGGGTFSIAPSPPPSRPASTARSPASSSPQGSASTP